MLQNPKQPYSSIRVMARLVLAIAIGFLFHSCGDKKQAGQKSPLENGTTEGANSPAPLLRYNADQLDNTTGLSNSSVNCIFRDSENLMWIGTWDGLNRYDGSAFRIFRPGPDSRNSLSNQVVLKVGEDSVGNIWVLTMHGINKYSKGTDTFTNFYFSKAGTPPASEFEFNMAINAAGEVFCAVKGWGLGYFDGTGFRKLTGVAIAGVKIRKMEFSYAGTLLLLTEDNELEKLTLSKSGDVWSVSDKRVLFKGIKSFETIKDAAVCLLTDAGNASLYNIATGSSIKLAGHAEKITGIARQTIILSGRHGHLFYDSNGKASSPSWAGHFAGHNISTVCEGSEGIVWGGTDGDGMLKIYPLKKTFNLVSKSQLPAMGGGIVRAFLNDGERLWVGTKGKGLLCLDGNFYRQQQQPRLLSEFNENNSTLNNAVYALSKGNDDIVLIGTDGEGLSVFDEKNKKLLAWKDIATVGLCPYFRSVYTIYNDPEGNTWLGTNGYGLIKCRISRVGGKISATHCDRYMANGLPKSLSSNIIFSVLPKDNNHLWVGTRLGGLNLFDKATGEFTSYKNIPGDSVSLANNDILCMATDARMRLWVGTSFGLSIMEGQNGRKPIFTNYTVANGLPNNTIHGIVPAEGGLWVSTNMGLSNFTPPGKFSNYTRNEGLQNNEFADGAFYRDPASGYIFMGGIKGFNYFLPEQIKESSAVPDLFIDRIAGHNDLVPYLQNLVIKSYAKSHPALVLKHDQNFFDIYLTALAYINNEKCQYAYQLEGFDKSWNTIDNRKVISFTNVPKGNYTLMVKWTNSDGVWTHPVNALDIRIRPVWWQSHLAIVLYVVLGALFLLFVRSYYAKQQSLRQNILFRKKEEELHENRLSFFTNIAHEFLTPLTLIVGPAQKMSDSANLDARNGKYLHMIQRNASRLLFLTQQLLEFRKAEYDYLENTVRRFDLTELAEQIAELFDDWALDKNIDYSIDLPPTLKGWYDKDKIEKILFNLMSNAFKYTPEKGHISLKCRIEPGTPKKLVITLANTGKGIPKEKLESLFDRFFLADAGRAADTEMFRTGIGLAYIKKLVTVLRGEIEVSSVPGQETIFRVSLPCSSDAFSEKEIDNENAPVLISRHLRNILDENPGTERLPEKISALEKAENTLRKVLVVEDEREIQAYLKDLLGDKYRLLSAYNGIEALEVMERELPDIIISDVMMPEMDGVELCKRVKQNLRTCHIPFIMLTAKSSVQHRIEGLESGANSYIPKPFYPDHLLVRIQKLLEEKELIYQHFTSDSSLQETVMKPGITSDEKDFTRSLIDLIRGNLENENLDAAYLEKHLGISSSQLYRKVKELFNLAPGDLIRTIRLKYAAELLRKNEFTVSEVCYKSGFNNRSYFYREFRKVYNTTPKSYQLHYKDKQKTF